MSEDTTVVHPAAAVGFERSADAYERGRPGFPDEAVTLLVDELRLRPHRTLVELGPGTGKLTRLLAPSGCRIVGVEPVAAMRFALARAVPGAEAVDAVAESLPLRDESVDAAVAAQAFHWFDPQAATAELARVLRDDAGVGLVWNVRDETTDWVRRLTELLEPFRGSTPSHRSMAWRTGFDHDERFEPLRLVSFAYGHETDREGVVDRVSSISFVATLPAREREGLAARVRALVPDGRVVFPYRTDVWLTRRRPRRTADGA